MNKFLTKIATFSVGLAMAIGVGVAVGSNGAQKAEARTENGSYSITFARASSADGTAASTSTAAADILSEGADYVSGNLATATLVGYNATYGIKLGQKSNTGTIKINLSTSGQVKAKSIVVAARRYNTGKTVSISANGMTAQGIGTSESVTNYTFTFASATDITYLELKTSGTQKYAYISGITVNYTYEVDDNAPTVTITNANKLAPHGVARALTAAITNDSQSGYTITWSCANANVTLSSTTGASITITASNAIEAGTVITIVATLNDSNSAHDSTTFYVSSKAADSTANAIPATEARALVMTGNIDGETLYVKGYANNASANLVWLSDNSDTTKSFEIYNKDGLGTTYAQGTYIVGHGSAKKYNTTPEVENGVVDSADYFALSTSSVEVNNTQYVDVTASNATGNITWTTVAGTGSVTLSNQSNTGVRITGASVGTATVTATLGNFTRSISVTVNKFANDWAFSDITLAANGEFQDTYYVGGELDVENLTVDYIEHSNFLNEDRHPTVDMNNVTFNFDSSETGTFNLTATYNEHTTDDIITIYIIERPDGIEFNNINYTQLSTSVLTDSAADANSVSWTVSATFSDDVSVTKTAAHIQIGAGSKRADSVQITADLGSAKTFTKLAFKCDAFSGDSGTISLKLDDTEIASGSINGTSVITVEPNNYVKGQEIQIDITNSGNLRVNLISVEYQAYTDDEMVSNFVRDNMHMDYDKDGVHGSTGGNGSCKSQGWYTTAKTNYGKLLDSQKLLFNTESKYAAAKQRLIDWAIANTEEFDPAAYTFTAQNSRAAFEGFVDSDNPSVISMIIVISLVSVTAIGGYFFMRKRKEIK